MITNIYFMDSTGFRFIQAPVRLTAIEALQTVKSEGLAPIDNRVLVVYRKNITPKG